MGRRVVLLSLAAAMVALALQDGYGLQRQRQDVHDLQRLLDLVAALYPELDGDARVAATLGRFGDGATSALVEVTISKAGSSSRQGDGKAPDRKFGGDLYAGTARFDARGGLLTYVARHTSGEERFATLKERWKQEPPSFEGFRASLKSAGATYVDSPPTVESSRSLQIIQDAIGRPTATTTSSEGLSVDQVSPAELVRTQVAWTVEMTVVRERTSRRYFIRIDPWGEVLSVGRYGEAWP